METQTVKRNFLHSYSKGSLAFSLAGLALNALILLALYSRSPLFPTLALDNLFLTGFCVMAALGLGVHALVKIRWPGNSVYEKYHKPRSPDAAVVLFAFALSAVNVAALWFYVLLLTSGGE